MKKFVQYEVIDKNSIQPPLTFSYEGTAVNECSLYGRSRDCLSITLITRSILCFMFFSIRQGV